MNLSLRPPLERRARRGTLVALPQGRAHVLTQGEGEPFVLLHGNASLGEEILSAFPHVKGVRWIAPDRPGYGLSDPLPVEADPAPAQAAWLEALLSRLGVGPVTLVAHSLAAAPALAVVARCPSLVRRLVLLAPFCRPTPQKPMLGMRLATAPVVGPPLRRYVVQPVARWMGERIVDSFMAPNRAPPWLRGFPVGHAARPQAVVTAAAELRSFNASIGGLEDRLWIEQPLTVVHGLDDRTADPAWHLPWLTARAADPRLILLWGCGHAVHHAAPNLVLNAVLHGEIANPRDTDLRVAAKRETRTDARPAAEDQHAGYAIA